MILNTKRLLLDMQKVANKQQQQQSLVPLLVSEIKFKLAFNSCIFVVAPVKGKI